MGAVKDLAEAFWRGSAATANVNPAMRFAGLEEIAPGVAFVLSFGNVVAFDTDDGLVLVDTGSVVTADLIHAELRKWSDRPLHTAIFTHGHLDHVFGVAQFDEEAQERGWPQARVIAHEAVRARFDRYRLTHGYNQQINARQFRARDLKWSSEFRYPDQTYRSKLDLEIGGVALELRHARGETDDHTWVWMPERRILCTGDMFIWATPNCGNPQKVQRYALDWAEALQKMARLDAETLLQGHGPPIFGVERIRTALGDTAALLVAVHDQTVALMNEGRRLDEIVDAVSIPAELAERPYLRSVYDEPAFMVRNLWRLYGGWYDGNPARLKPPADALLAAEVAALAGGAPVLAERARALVAAGEMGLASQLAEWAWQAAPDDEEVRAARAAVYSRRAKGETSLMARSIFQGAAEDDPAAG